MKTSEVGYDYLDRAGPCPGPCLDCLKQCEPSCETFEERWRWLLEVREVKGFTGAGGHIVRVFKVYNPRDSWDGLRAQVWIGSDGKPACTVCSGPFSAMLSTCRHCRAVRRYLEKAKK